MSVPALFNPRTIYVVPLQIPVRDAEAHRPDGVSAALRLSPRRPVSAALPAGEDTMHAGGADKWRTVDL